MHETHQHEAAVEEVREKTFQDHSVSDVSHHELVQAQHQAATTRLVHARKLLPSEAARVSEREENLISLARRCTRARLRDSMQRVCHVLHVAQAAVDVQHKV